MNVVGYYIYFVLAFAEAYMAYIIFRAISFKIVPAEEIYKHYLCCGGFVECSKDDLKNSSSRCTAISYNQKNETIHCYYKRDIELFLNEFRFHVKKFDKYFIFIAFLLFCIPFLLYPCHEKIAINTFFLIGGVALFLLVEWSLNETHKRNDEEITKFYKMLDNGNTSINFAFLTEEEKNAIFKIVHEGYYRHAEMWLTQSEREILKNLENDWRYYYLTQLIENGAELIPADDYYKEIHPFLGIRRQHEK